MAEVQINGVVYKLSCTMSDCDNGLHCFRSNQTLQRKGIEKGCCRYCKSSLVDWDRLYMKDINDFAYTKQAFKLEMIRNFFWSIQRPNRDMVEKINKLSPDQLNETINKRLITTLAKPHNENSYDGRQTPVDENLVHWAQHATGTCCRTCLEEWYGIDANATIADKDYEYLNKVITAYIQEKINT